MLSRVSGLIVVVLLALATAGPARAEAAADKPSTSSAAKYGAETLATIQSTFFMPDRSLYAEQVKDGKPDHPSWIWDASIQLGALCTAARLEPDTYLPQAKAYATALRSYRTTTHDRPGFDVNPPPKNPDRYYDDNAWICLSLLEAHALTHDPDDLKAATEAYDFMMSGAADGSLGGGIYWHEDRPTSKNACSSGPAMLASLAFYDRTREPRYLDTAKRLYDWTRARLQDPDDGLVYDSIRVTDGRVNKAKYTYNSATLIRAACGLYRVTGEGAYLDEAHRVARAAEERFVRKEDGLLTGAGKLGVKLVEAFLDLADTDHDDHWRQVVARCLTALHTRRNAAGFYPTNWPADPPPPDRPVRLIDQAAPARAYWIAAEHGVDVQ